MNEQQPQGHTHHETLVVSQLTLRNVSVDVEDASVELLGGWCVLADALYDCLHLFYLLMNTIFMPALGVELYLLLDVVAVDEDTFVFICLGVKNSHSVFKCKIQLKVGPQIDDFSDSVDHHETFGLHV